MTKGKTKANSNRAGQTESANWWNWEIKDFQYQVEVFNKSGRISEGAARDTKSEPSENHKSQTD